MSTPAWLNDLATRLGAAPALDEDGRAGLRHASGVEVELHVDLERAALHLCATVAPVPAVDVAACLERLLRLNALRRGALDPAFALDRDGRNIVLSLSLPAAGLDAATIAGALDALAARSPSAREDVAAA